MITLFRTSLYYTVLLSCSCSIRPAPMQSPQVDAMPSVVEACCPNPEGCEPDMRIILGSNAKSTLETITVFRCCGMVELTDGYERNPISWKVGRSDADSWLARAKQLASTQNRLTPMMPGTITSVWLIKDYGTQSGQFSFTPVTRADYALVGDLWKLILATKPSQPAKSTR